MSSISLCFLRWEEERLVWDFQSHLWGLRADKEAALDARWRARPLPMAPVAALSLRVRVCYGCCSSQAISGGVNVNATDPERQWRISCVVNHVRSNARASHHGSGFSSARLIISSWANPPGSSHPHPPIPHSPQTGQTGSTGSSSSLTSIHCSAFQCFINSFISRILFRKMIKQKEREKEADWMDFLHVNQLDLSRVKQTFLSIV